MIQDRASLAKVMRSVKHEIKLPNAEEAARYQLFKEIKQSLYSRKEMSRKATSKNRDLQVILDYDTKHFVLFPYLSNGVERVVRKLVTKTNNRLKMITGKSIPYGVRTRDVWAKFILERKDAILFNRIRLSRKKKDDSVVLKEPEKPRFDLYSLKEIKLDDLVNHCKLYGYDDFDERLYPFGWVPQHEDREASNRDFMETCLKCVKDYFSLTKKEFSHFIDKLYYAYFPIDDHSGPGSHLLRIMPVPVKPKWREGYIGPIWGRLPFIFNLMNSMSDIGVKVDDKLEKVLSKMYEQEDDLPRLNLRPRPDFSVLRSTKQG